MRYISPDDRCVGFAAGEDVKLHWAIYEDASRKVEYELKDDDVITFCVRRKASPESEVLIWAESSPGTSDVEILAEDTAWIRPGQYTAFAVISIPSRNVDEMMIWPPIDNNSQGVFPVGNCVIAAGGRGVVSHG